MATQSQSKFENENINVTLERKPGCRICLEVTVSPKAVKASRLKAVENVRKEVSIPGFRKGKAPEGMILTKYEKPIEGEWKDIVLNSCLEEAIQLTKIYPFNKNSVKSASIKSISLDDGAKLTYEYEAAPTIPSVSADNLSIAKIPLKQVTEKDIENTIHDLLLQSGEWQEITDRPVQAGDYVVVDIDNIGDNGHNICRETVFEVKKGKMADWMFRHLQGMKVGDIVEAMSEKDKHDKHDKDCKECADGSHSHDDKFVPTMCRIMLHTIKHVIPHALDDALATKYGATNVADLKEKVKLSLEKRAADEQKDTQRQLMEKEIFNQYPFDIPTSIIQSEVKAAKEAFINRMREQGVSQDKIAKETKTFEAQAAEKYDRDFRLYFLTQKMAQENNIQIDNNEVMEELMRQMWLQQSGQGNIDLASDPKEVQTIIRMRLMAQKALDFFVEKAKEK